MALLTKLGQQPIYKVRHPIEEDEQSACKQIIKKENKEIERGSDAMIIEEKFSDLIE